MSPKDQTKAVLLVVVIWVVASLAFGLLPVRAAGRLKCDAPLRGADPKELATEGYLVNREKMACSDKSGSRLTIVGIVGLLYLAFGISAIVLPESSIERVAFGGEDPEDVYEMNN